MEIIFNPRLNPYFNLASEQLMLEGTDDVFMIWRNASSVIIGKNQNAFAEIDLAFVENNNIKVARRLTGGGAVFHDEGNINYTFITDADGDGIDFAKFTAPVCEALESFGVKAVLGGRNDLLSNGLKISGNAQCVYDTKDGRKRLLHHGTLLFSADISRMAGALKVSPEKLRSKGIKSVPSRVTNIINIPEYSGPATPEEFAMSLISFAENRFSAESRDFSEDKAAQAEKLSEEKFSRWEWIFGKSPEYTKTSSRRFPYGTVEIGVCAVGGILRNVGITGDFFGSADVGILCEKLAGTRMTKSDIVLAAKDADLYISGASPEEIADLILE